MRSPAEFTAGHTMRVSLSALLRIRHDDQLVLFHMPSRPGSYGPPGGVFKYFHPATSVLDKLDFRHELSNRRPNPTKADLRGFLPAANLRDFLHWYSSGAYRETAVECLARELFEELAEVGLPHLADSMRRTDFTHLRTVNEGPHEVPGKSYRQYRRFEVYDLVTADSNTLWLLQELVAAGADPTVPLVTCANGQSVRDGRHGTTLVAPQTAFLLGHMRVLPDIPPVT